MSNDLPVRSPSDTFRTLAEAGEHRLLEWVRARAAAESSEGRGGLVLGIGDDASVLSLAGANGSGGGRAGGNAAIVTTDALIEAVHFRHEWTPPRDLGAKALAVNLSDLAAMAARPVAAFLSLGAPPETALADLEEFFEGFLEEGTRHGCPLAGGDLVRAPVWMIAVTAIGRPAVPGRVATRAAALPGWNLYVTGAPGESAAGLEELRRADARAPGSARTTTSRCIERHRRPTPRLAEAAALAAAFEELAMLDVSDGIFNDAGQMARASGTCVEIEFETLPVSEALRAASDDPRSLALFGGEDYELLFATPHGPEAVAAALAATASTSIHRIGRVVPSSDVHPGAVVIDAGGAVLPLPNRTFRHFS